MGSCSWELVDSESELDELLSEPLELSLDDDVPEVDPELDSVLVDYKKKNKLIGQINIQQELQFLPFS